MSYVPGNYSSHVGTFTLIVKSTVLPLGGFNHVQVQIWQEGNPGFDDRKEGVFRVLCETKAFMEAPHLLAAPHRFQRTDLIEGEVTYLSCLALK